MAEIRQSPHFLGQADQCDTRLDRADGESGEAPWFCWGLGLLHARSARLAEPLLRREGVHRLVAADVVLADDGRVSVFEELRGKLESANLLDRMFTRPPALPPLATRLHLDTLKRGSRFRARVRWTDPSSRERRSRSVAVDDEFGAREFFELMRAGSIHKIDPFISLSDYALSIGGRFVRGVDPTSTAAGYRAGLHLRVVLALGHLRIHDITTRLIYRTIDHWESEHSRSTLKGTIVALTRILGEAVPHDLIARNPVRNRADRRYHQSTELQRARPVPSPDEVVRIAEACAAIHQSYGHHIMLSAFLAARSSEVAGLIVDDVDWTSKLVTIERQCSPGTGGRSIKPPRVVEFAAFRSSSH